MSNYFTREYPETYALAALGLIYFSFGLSLLLPGCNFNHRRGEQRPIPVKSIPIRERNDKSLPIKKLESELIEQMPAPIERPKQENKPVPQRPVPRDEGIEEDTAKPAFAIKSFRLEYRLG